MSNWYGMNNFPKVYDFHKSRFKGSDSIQYFLVEISMLSHIQMVEKVQHLKK